MFLPNQHAKLKRRGGRFTQFLILLTKVKGTVQGRCFKNVENEHGASLLASIHHQSNVVSLEQNATDFSSSVLFSVNLLSIIQGQVHVLVKSQKDALNAKVGLFVQPHLDSSFGLVEAKHQVDGSRHRLLYSLRHGGQMLEYKLSQYCSDVWFHATKISTQQTSKRPTIVVKQPVARGRSFVS
eukprot:TRINITY_DN5004_c0_g1_i1.p1 TRINITY_DN5004_c0_g1~~TRINITY_DN5004_c0_g1_i1.p1  ORF type:complete len:183 (-),score=6.86 TRINITY_DN5004_c0_g1_i1:36-584(-)